MAEFSLPRPIMMAAMMLTTVRTRTATIKISHLVAPSRLGIAMFVNPNQSDAVLDDYIGAMIEQVREGDLQRNNDAYAYYSRRLDPVDYERYLDVLDLKMACGKIVREPQKAEFYMRCSNSDSSYKAFVN